MNKHFIIVLVMLAVPLYSQDTNTFDIDRYIAVSTFSPSGVSESEALSLTDVLQTHLAQSGSFIIMERTEIDKVLKEQGFQQIGSCSETSCAVEMGQLLGVRYIVLGSIGLVGKTYTVNARLTDVRTGKIVRNVTELHKGSIDGLVTKVMPEVAGKLAGRIDKVNKKSVKPAHIIAGITGILAVPAAILFIRSQDSSDDPQPQTSEVTIQWGE